MASFMSRVEIKNANDCWLWKGCTYNCGYGSFLWRGKMRGANRVAWEIANGQDVPEGMDVCHTCDRPLCVNPAHLWLGTHRDNMLDAVKKGRNAHGEKSRVNKITEAQARRILAMRPVQYPRRTMGLAGTIAKEHRITMGAVHAIWRGKSWKHIQ